VEQPMTARAALMARKPTDIWRARLFIR